MSFKPSENEEEYFKKEEARLRLGLKKEIVKSEAEISRHLAIAERVGSGSAEIGEALEDLGFSVDDAAVLPLVPLLEIAWADGKMQYQEASLILDTARKRGLSAASAAYTTLKRLTDTRPSDAFFHTCNQIFGELLREKDGPDADITRHSTVELMTRVAEASGGFFGLTNAIDEEERKVMAQLVQELGLKP